MIAPEEDEDVVFEGTALYEHLVQNGFASEMEMPNKPQSISEQEKIDHLDENTAGKELQNSRPNIYLLSKYKTLQNKFTIKILKSELLVLEDEEFMQNFIILESNADGTQTFDRMSSFLRILVPLSASALSGFLLKKFIEKSRVDWKTSTAALSLSMGGLWSLYHIYRGDDHVNMENMSKMLETMAEFKEDVNKVDVL